jgi:CHAT domain-containing protein
MQNTSFHFTGHGEQHPLDPSKSSLLVTDCYENPLTVEDVLKKQLHQDPPFLVYLFACSTGRVETPPVYSLALDLTDEGIHLTSVCILAGFLHVIGSLLYQHKNIDLFGFLSTIRAR